MKQTLNSHTMCEQHVSRWHELRKCLMPTFLPRVNELSISNLVNIAHIWKWGKYCVTISYMPQQLDGRGMFNFVIWSEH